MSVGEDAAPATVGSPTAAEPAVPHRSGSALGGGSVLVSAGLLVFGLSTYGFLTLAARGTRPAEFSALATLWSLVYGLGAGLFAPLEQELTRAVAQRRARGESIRPVAVRITALGGALTVVAVLVLLAVREPLAGRVLGGRPDLVGWLCVTLAVFAGLYLCRGLFAGTARFGAYGGQFVLEGLLRMGAAVALVLAAAGTASRFAAVMALAPLVTLVLSLPLLPRPGGVHRGSSWGEATTNLGWLLLATLTWQAVANAGPVVLSLLDPADQGLAGRFLAAFVIVRIPLFFTSALQSSLLPHLVRAVEQGDVSAFRRALAQVCGLVAGLGVVGLAGLAAIGPWLLGRLYGPQYVVGRLDLLVLAVSSLLFLLAALLQSAVVALGGHRVVAWACLGSGVLFAAACLIPLAPFPRLDLAYLIGSVAVAVAMAAALVNRGRGRWTARATAR